MDMNEAIITLDNLSIGYNGQTVLSGISLSIARDSFTAILGANGSGKSTLLKTLIGLLPPISGRIVSGASMGDPLVFGYVPQVGQFDPIYLLTGFDVALMGAYGRVRPGRLVPQSERAFTRECLRVAGAEDLARKSFSELRAARSSACSLPALLSRTRTSWCLTNRPRAWMSPPRIR